MRRGAPTVVGDEELAFDFDRHGKGRDSGFEARLPSAAPALPNPQSRIPNPGLQGSNIAIDSTCAVCGNMSITPAARSFKPRSLTRYPASRASDDGGHLKYTIRLRHFRDRKTVV